MCCPCADFDSEFRITELSRRQRRLVVESDDHLRPVISVETEPHATSGSSNKCILRIGVYYNRKSALFQVRSGSSQSGEKCSSSTAVLNRFLVVCQTLGDYVRLAYNMYCSGMD